MSTTISIKGTREGLTITLGEGELPDLMRDLQDHLATQGAFFRGGTVALQVGDRPMVDAELARIGQVLEEHEMILRTVISGNAVTQQSVRTLGLRLLGSESPADAAPARPTAAPLARPLEGTKGILVHHVIRSGQIVRHTGHVAVVGDVNSGAEIVAGGDVVVWGRLMGAVHAGAMGDNDCVVCALQLTPQVLRIGTLIGRGEDRDHPAPTYPEIASVRDDRIVVEPWDRAQRGT